MRPASRIGRYEVLDHLASGGMGQVYLARATGLGGFERQVVIKTLDPGGTYEEDDDAFVTMFLDEARLVGALHHQYIAPVHEVGCDENGRYFLVMDYIHGETAEAIWKASETRSCRVPLGLSLTIGSAIASALDYAHNVTAPDGTALEIVHRDVSLSNIMIGHDGSVRLIDFGIARSVQRASRTEAGMLKGKIGYLAPEQVIHRPIDRRTDVFALGIVMYELTTATRAFQDASDLVTFERITRGDLAPPSKVVANYPPELERIVLRALATEPVDRYQDAGAMGRDLEAVAARLGVTLGHSTVCEGLALLFGGRRRVARGSDGLNQPIDGVDTKPDIPSTIHDQPTAAIPRTIDAERTEPASVAVLDVGPELVPLMVKFRRPQSTPKRPTPTTKVERPITDRSLPARPIQGRPAPAHRWIFLAIAAVVLAIVLGIAFA